jgi:hypothetical protein
MKRLLITLILLVFSAFAAVAQDNESSNDPRVNENANACFAGGTMEGKCNVDFDGNGTVDEYEVTWAWECGWYIIRVNAGMISSTQMPERCQTLLPADTCFSTSLGVSFRYSGNPNEPGNVVGYLGAGCASDFTLSGANSVLIFANSLDEATAICSQFGTVIFIRELNNIGYDTPDGIYGCTLA